MIDRFFKNNEGKWAVIQLPNVLLSIWLVLLFVNFIIHNQHLMQLQEAVLFAWAYMEFTGGDSYFRKALGAVVLVITVIGFFG